MVWVNRIENRPNRLEQGTTADNGTYHKCKEKERLLIFANMQHGTLFHLPSKVSFRRCEDGILDKHSLTEEASHVR